MTDTNIFNDDNSKSRNRETADKVKKDKDIESKKVPEQGGVQTSHGKDPTRFGDWEKNGRAIDF